MPYEIYKVLHYLGLALLFTALGGVALHGANGGTKEDNKNRGLVAATHGIGLVLLLVAGFGMLAKTGRANPPPWAYIKIAIWMLMGGSLAIINRKPELAKVMWFVLPILAAVSGYVAISKPGELAAAPAAETESQDVK